MVWLTKDFITTAIIVFLAFYTVMYLSSVVAYNNSFSVDGIFAANQTYQNIQSIRQTVTWTSIFLNNFEASIIMIIPVGGVIIFFFVMWNTGQILGQLASVTGYTPFVYLMGVSVPIGLTETLAYTILGAESLYLGYLSITKKDAKNRLLHNSWKSLILYLVILVVASIMEAALI